MTNHKTLGQILRQDSGYFGKEQDNDNKEVLNLFLKVNLDILKDQLI